MKPKTILEKADSLPPFVCFALARRRGHKAPTPEELAKAAGLAHRTFMRIAAKYSWSTVEVGHMEKFTLACGVDLLHQRKHRSYLRRSFRHGTAFSHLSRQRMAVFNRKCLVWEHMKHGN